MRHKVGLVLVCWLFLFFSTVRAEKVVVLKEINKPNKIIPRSSLNEECRCHRKKLRSGVYLKDRSRSQRFLNRILKIAFNRNDKGNLI